MEHFCPYCGEIKYYHPDVLNVLGLLGGGVGEMLQAGLGLLVLPRKVVADSRQQCQVFFLSL